MGTRVCGVASNDSSLSCRKLNPNMPVRQEDRPRYIAALNEAQAGGGDDAFRTLLYERRDATLDEILEAFAQARPVE